MAQMVAPTVEPPLAPRLAIGPGARAERKSLEFHRRAAEFRALRLQNERGEIPPNGLVRAWEQKRQMVRIAKLPAPAGPAPAGPSSSVAGIPPGGWTWLGPGNIGGRTRSIVIHPTTPTTMWLGGVDGGVWKTVNGGIRWFPLDDFMANMSVGTLVLDPANFDVIYAGTGEIYFGGGRVRGAGVFKSPDGGTTWSQLPSTATGDFHYVNRLAIHPSNGQIILAATATGIHRSTDAGVSWSKRYPAPTASAVISDIDFHPTDGNQCIASGLNGLALHSTDGGQTWNSATGISVDNDVSAGRVEVAYSRSNPSYVYAHVDNKRLVSVDPVTGKKTYEYGEVYRSIDGGNTYVLRSNGNTIGGQGFFNNTLWVDPTNPDIVVMGGIYLWRSIDGGSHFNNIGGYSYVHADQHVIVEHPNFDGSTEKRAFVGTDGGIFVANDIYTATPNSGWTELNNNLGITQFYGGAGDPGSGVIIGGTQDNGTLRYDPAAGAENWTATSIGGDGGVCAVDQADAKYFYGQTQGPIIERSTNRGVSFATISSGITDPTGWIVPFILDPNNGNTMLVGPRGVWRSTDVKAASPAWTKIKDATVSPRPDNDGSLVTAIAVAPGNPDIIWVGDYYVPIGATDAVGAIYKTSNGTSASRSWTTINVAALPKRFVGRITIDLQNPSIVYVGFGGYSSDNVWRTSDGGLTWSDISGALPDAPVWSLVIHPTNPNWIYVGTDVGVFASEDAGANWSVPSGGPANVEVDELFWMGSSLVAATWGRGMFASQPTRDPLILYVDCNYSGVNSDGTLERPFRTIRQGYLAASNGDTLRVSPGNYPETIGMSKRLRVERTFGGPVHIGH